MKTYVGTIKLVVIADSEPKANQLVGMMMASQGKGVVVDWGYAQLSPGSNSRHFMREVAEEMKDALLDAVIQADSCEDKPICGPAFRDEGGCECRDEAVKLFDQI